LARTDADSQTAHVGNRRAREQDGTDRLGATYKAGELQGSGLSQGVSLLGRGRRRCSRSKEGKAQQSARRGWKNQMYSSCLEHAFMIWFRSANSHTGPQLHRCIRGRTDGSIRLRADILQKPLASRGASTDGFTA